MADWDPYTPHDGLAALEAPARYETTATLRAATEATERLAELEAEAAAGGEARDALEQAARLREAWATCRIETVETELGEVAENEHHATGEYRIRQVVGAARAWRTEAARESGDGAGAPSTERAAAWCGEMKRTKMNVRSGRVFIGNRYEVVYMPPQGERRLRDMLEDLWRFTAAPSGDPIVRMAMAHHQFESIHPFEDGNGRTGRLLNAVLLHRSGVAGSRLAAPSAGILARRWEYYARLRAATAEGDWEGWVVFLAGTLAAEAAHARETWRRHSADAGGVTAKWLVRTPRDGDAAVLRQAALRITSTAGEIAGRHGAPETNATRRMLERLRKWNVVTRKQGRGRRPYINRQALETWRKGDQP